MSLAQDRLVMAAWVLSESVWLYALLSLVGLAVGLGGSPLGWVAVLAIMGTAYLVTRPLQRVLMPMAMAYLIQMMVGGLVLFLTLGTQVVPEGQGLDLAWLGKLSSGSETQRYALRAALGGILGAALWWRGGKLASAETPVEDLSTSFRQGAIALAAVAVVDIFHSANLRVFPLMFLFFAAGLAGLSIGHVLPASRRAAEERTWPRVIGGVVSVVVVAGVLFSLLRGNVLSLLSVPALAVLKALATVVFWVFIIPLGFLVQLMIKGLRSLLDRLNIGGEGRQLVERPDGFLDSLRRLREGAGEQGPSTLLHVLEWVLVAILVAVVLYLLAKAFRRGIRWRRVHAEGSHESLGEDVDPAYDMARLVLNLVPHRFKKAKPRRTLTLPQDDPDVVDVFRIYFGLMRLAEDRGFPRPPADTPTEYQRTLEAIFPGDLVRGATAAFNRACYGHHPAPRQRIEEMRLSLERLASGTG